MTGQGYGWVLVGVRGCVLWPTGHSLDTLFPYLCRLRTGHCIGFQLGHRLIILSTYLFMGAGKARCSLVVGSGSVGAKSDQQVNIYSFVMRCDQMRPSTQ